MICIYYTKFYIMCSTKPLKIFISLSKCSTHYYLPPQHMFFPCPNYGMVIPMYCFMCGTNQCENPLILDTNQCDNPFILDTNQL